MPRTPLIVSREAVDSGDPDEISFSNCSFVWAQREALLRENEIHPAALYADAVVGYEGQCNNGGFSQFLYNARGHPERIDHTREGLRAIGAVQHLALYDQLVAAAESLGNSRLKRFFASSYFGRNAERDALNNGDDDFSALLEVENLNAMTGTWLARHPELTIIPEDDFAAKVQELVGVIVPDLPARRAAALAAESRFMKLIRALATAAGHQYQRTTAGDPMYQFEGRQTLGWHFFTDRGHFVMIDCKKTAVMLEHPGGRVVVTIPAKGIE